MPPDTMPTVSLPLELLIKIIEFALDNQKEYTFGRIAQPVNRSMPKISGGLDKILTRDTTRHTSINLVDLSANRVGIKVGDSPYEGIIKDTERARKKTTRTYTLTTALRLYVIITF
jgi:hypothetical protein